MERLAQKRWYHQEYRFSEFQHEQLFKEGRYGRCILIRHQRKHYRFSWLCPRSREYGLLLPHPRAHRKVACYRCRFLYRGNDRRAVPQDLQRLQGVHKGSRVVPFTWRVPGRRWEIHGDLEQDYWGSYRGEERDRWYLRYNCWVYSSYNCSWRRKAEGDRWECHQRTEERRSYQEDSCW